MLAPTLAPTSGDARVASGWPHAERAHTDQRGRTSRRGGHRRVRHGHRRHRRERASVGGARRSRGPRRIGVSRGAQIAHQRTAAMRPARPAALSARALQRIQCLQRQGVVAKLAALSATYGDLHGDLLLAEAAVTPTATSTHAAQSAPTPPAMWSWRSWAASLQQFWNSFESIVSYSAVMQPLGLRGVLCERKNTRKCRLESAVCTRSCRLALPVPRRSAWLRCKVTWLRGFYGYIRGPRRILFEKIEGF